MRTLNPGEICPNGFYCPSGTYIPKKCPAGLVITKRGARSINECDLCPGGSYCEENEDPTIATQQKACEIGHFCEYGRANSFESVPCPVGTFNPEIGSIDS